MRILLLILALTFAAETPAQYLAHRRKAFRSVPSVTADVLLDFEADSDGTAIDATWLNANTRGTPVNSWAVIGTGTSTVSAEDHAYISPFLIGATTYSSAGTRGGKFQLSTGQRGFQFQLNSPYTLEVTLSCWFKTTMPSDATTEGQWDLVNLENSGGGGSQWCDVQLQGNPLQVHAHANDGATTRGAEISLSANTWYFFSLKYQNSGTRGAYLSVFSSTGTLLGTSFCAFGASTEGVRFVQIGNVGPHGQTSTGYFYFDGIAVDYTDATHPLGP